MTSKPKILLISAVALAVMLTAFVLSARHHHRHALVGCWQAADSTVFIFRNDGTFIGRDFRGRRIFGNWIELNKYEIGFQSLMHASFYSPQYAELTPFGMRYAYSDSAGFINAVRIDPDTAERQVALATLNQKSHDEP